MNARTLILAILNQQAASGYEIRKMCLEGPFSHFIDISYGSIYPTLAKLEAEAKVQLRVEHADGKPDRKIYSITQLGRSEFIETMAQPPARDVFKSEFLLLASSIEYTSRQAIERALDDRIIYLQSQIAMINEYKSGNQPDGVCWVCDYGEYMMQCDLDYLVRNRDRLVAMAGSANELSQAAE